MAKGKKHKSLPQGMNYAQKLAQQKMVKEAVEKAARDETVRIRADIRAQQELWLQVVSMADAFGIGDKRILHYFEVLGRNSEELEAMAKEHGREYALEKLRQRAEKVAGIPIEYLYEREILEAKARNEAKGVFFPLLED